MTTDSCPPKTVTVLVSTTGSRSVRQVAVRNQLPANFDRDMWDEWISSFDPPGDLKNHAASFTNVYEQNQQNALNDIKLINSVHTASRSGYVCASDRAVYSAGGASGEVFAIDRSTGGFLVSSKQDSDYSPLQKLSFVEDQPQQDDGSVMDFGGLRHGAHSADLSPDGKTVYVADIGRNAIFTFSVDRLEYSVTAQGHGRCSDGRSAPRQFTLPLTRGARIERLWYLALGQDLYLIYEDEDSESGAGTVARLMNDLRPSWTAHVPGFNIGEGVVEDGHLYLTAIGFVAKLNLKTGRYAWAHRNLYADGHFNSFQRPDVEKSHVTFTEKLHKPQDSPPRSITVEKSTGKMVRR